MTTYLAAACLVAASATSALAQIGSNESASNPPPQSYGPYGPGGPYAPYDGGAQIGSPLWVPSEQGIGLGSSPSMGSGNGYSDSRKASNPPISEYEDGFAKPQ